MREYNPKIQYVVVNIIKIVLLFGFEVEFLVRLEKACHIT